MAHNGDDSGFGFRIPSTWPRWKVRCTAHKRRFPDQQCSMWAVRGMATCRKHGSGGAQHRKEGLIRYLAWITCGLPKDTPIEYCRMVSVSTALDQLFNHGVGNPEQRLRAGLWVAEITSSDTGSIHLWNNDDTGA